jgi:hypothetical protein
MEREPQINDHVRIRISPAAGEDGSVVARAEVAPPKGWYVGVRLKDGSIWKGLAKDVELLEAAGEAGTLQGTRTTTSKRAGRA